MNTETNTKTAEELLVRLHVLNAAINTTSEALKKAIEELPEKAKLLELETQRKGVNEELRALFTEPGKLETPAGKVSLVAARKVEHDPDAVRLFAPEIAAAVIKKIPAREEVDRVALERALKAGIKAGNIEPDTLEKLLTRAKITEIAPAFKVELEKDFELPFTDVSEALETADAVAPF